MSIDREKVRLLGRNLEDVREHLTVVKSEIKEIERRFELILNELAGLVAKPD